ncbi:MAG: Holliday junction resolvase [Spirochaetaceae bacterium]|nr:Holliday junction resolvase [Spirochaetaceae bacterium]
MGTRVMEFVQAVITHPAFYPVLCALLLILLVIQTVRVHKDRRRLRSDAINRSRAVIGGQVVEQVAPFLPGFPCNPADARFIGKPVDFVAFPGLSESDSVDEVLLIEVKTGNSALNAREKEIRRAVKEGRVRYVEYRFSDK